MDSWQVVIQDHHDGYISWEEFLKNQELLERNRTNGEETLLSGPAREGLALLQGLLLCARCGRKLSVRYTGNGGIYPTYQCNWMRREGLSGSYCMSIRCNLVDDAVSKRVLEVIQPAQLAIAVEALGQLEQREDATSRQWEMRIERAQYEAQLAERRYEEVDPSNRLVAGTLERRWNDALVNLEQLQTEYATLQGEQGQATTPEQKARIMALAQDLPRLWNASTTKAKDRKRMLRLLIKDVTVERLAPRREAVLHVRWQGGATEDIRVTLPPKVADQVRYPETTVQRVRELADKLTDSQIVEELNRQGLHSAKGKTFTQSMVGWIRHKYKIAGPQRRPEELTVRQLADKFEVSPGVVYYWIERKVIQARRLNRGSPYWVTLDAETEDTLRDWISNSTRIQRHRNQQDPETML
jgi:hypothetical protein